LGIISALLAEGVKLKLYDPQAIPRVKELLKAGYFGKNALRRIVFSKNAYEASRAADCLIIVTEWNEFKDLDFKKLKKSLKRPIIIDGRNIYDPQVMKKAGFVYVSMGRGSRKHG